MLYIDIAATHGVTREIRAGVDERTQRNIRPVESCQIPLDIRGHSNPMYILPDADGRRQECLHTID